MIEPSDLLVVGGLSVDHFPDGSEALGGSVLHGARALATAGLRPSTLTVAGPEQVARAGLRTLRSFGPLLVHDASSSIHFSIDERRSPRLLVYEAGARLPLTASDVAALPARALLAAPIAEELDASALEATSAAAVRVGALQGWLRVLVPGEPVVARRLDGLGHELSAALRRMAALVASDEDLAADGPDAGPAMDALREWAGPDPVLVVTAGEAGLLLDVPGRGRASVPAVRPLGQGPTVGAGDAFAALFAAGLGRALDPVAAAAGAASGVARWLALRAGAGDS